MDPKRFQCRAVSDLIPGWRGLRRRSPPGRGPSWRGEEDIDLALLFRGSVRFSFDVRHARAAKGKTGRRDCDHAGYRNSLRNLTGMNSHSNREQGA
jgi:hypothetical protein